MSMFPRLHRSPFQRLVEVQQEVVVKIFVLVLIRQTVLPVFVLTLQTGVRTMSIRKKAVLALRGGLVYADVFIIYVHIELIVVRVARAITTVHLAITTAMGRQDVKPQLTVVYIHSRGSLSI